MRYFIELSYNGKAYHGWQIQPNAISVQEVLEKALSVIFKIKISIVGAGRTDSGVHSKQIFAHFDTKNLIDVEETVYKLNALLPKDIAVYTIFRVSNESHARFNATSRSYVYRLSPKKDAFNTCFAYYFKPKLDVNAMNKAAELLIGFKDFECFSKSNTDVFTYNCDLRIAEWKIVDNELHFFITADRFLRNMVRAIVGTLINVGIGKLQPEDMTKILASKNRAEAGYSVPAHGLYLTEVVYPESIKNYE
ncbi:tRNA pseudouridine(38-40) synthase TruA [Aurantibacter sp.]|uniref:tRNA pseudouridine(38-40) synthase TruA n=1 Tax=Aurantibacter sp. TaxID=2807103 RepID=UPI0035C80105